jgi:hypothetical protein
MAILWRHSSHEIAAVEVLGYAHIPGNLSYIDRDRTVTQRNPKDPDIVIDQTAAGGGLFEELCLENRRRGLASLGRPRPLSIMSGR